MNSKSPNKDAEQLFYRVPFDGFLTNLINTKFTRSFIRTQTLPEVTPKDIVLYNIFCFISFFVLCSNVRWRKVSKRTIMLLNFTFLILSNYGFPIRWALSRFESGIQLNFYIRFSTIFFHLFEHITRSFLQMVLRLFSNKVFDFTALFLHKKL